MSMDDVGRLTFLSGEVDRGANYILKIGKCSIGCGKDATIRMKTKDSTVKDVQCIINVNRNGVATLINKAPLNPVCLNEEVVTRSKCLQHGDIIKIADKRLLYENNNLPSEDIQKTEQQRKSWRFALKTPTAGRKSMYITKNMRRTSMTPDPKKITPIVPRKKRSSSFSNLNDPPDSPALFKTPANRRTVRMATLHQFDIAKLPEKFLPSKLPSTPQIEQGLQVVVVPMSSTRPSRSTIRSEVKSRIQSFVESNENDIVRDLKTPVIDDSGNGEDNFTTPHNNTSLVLVESPIREDTPVRSRRSMVKNQVIQRLTKNDDSIVVLDTPNSKTPKSALKSGMKEITPKSVLKKSLINELMGNDMCTSTPAKRKSMVTADYSMRNNTSVMSDFTEESVYDISISNLSTVEGSPKESIIQSKVSIIDFIDTNASTNLSPEKRLRSEIESSKKLVSSTVQTESKLTKPSTSVSTDVDDINFNFPVHSLIHRSELISSRKSMPLKLAKIGRSKLKSTRKSMSSVVLHTTDSQFKSRRKSLTSVDTLDRIFDSINSNRRSMRISKASFTETESKNTMMPSKSDSIIKIIDISPSVSSKSGSEWKKSLTPEILEEKLEDSFSDVKTPMNTTNPLTKSALKSKRSSIKLSKTESTPSGTASLPLEQTRRSLKNMSTNEDSSTLDSDLTESSHNSSTSRMGEKGKRKRGRQSDDSMQSHKRLRYDESTFAQSFESSLMESLELSSEINEVPQDEISCEKQAVTEPKVESSNILKEIHSNKKRMSRRNLSPTNLPQEREVMSDMDNCGDTTIESIDTSSFIYLSGEASSQKSIASSENEVTPKLYNESKNDVTNVKRVKRLRKKKAQKEPLNDLTSLRGVKQLMKTPKLQKEPENDLTNPLGVKRILRTPKVQKQPENDLTNPLGVKRLLRTPKVQKQPENDLSNPFGVKKLLKTPQVQTSPKNDLSNPFGVKKLLKTPKVQKSPKNDLSNPLGIKRLMSTREQQNEPKNDLTNPLGLKKLLKTPKVKNEPKNDLSNPLGVKKLMRSPKSQSQPKNDLTDVEGVFELFMNNMNVSGCTPQEEIFDQKQRRTYSRKSRVSDTLSPVKVLDVFTEVSPDVRKWIDEQNEISTPKISNYFEDITPVKILRSNKNNTPAMVPAEEINKTLSAKKVRQTNEEIKNITYTAEKTPGSAKKDVHSGEEIVNVAAEKTSTLDRTIQQLDNEIIKINSAKKNPKLPRKLQQVNEEIENVMTKKTPASTRKAKPTEKIEIETSIEKSSKSASDEEIQNVGQPTEEIEAVKNTGTIRKSARKDKQTSAKKVKNPLEESETIAERISQTPDEEITMKRPRSARNVKKAVDEVMEANSDVSSHKTAESADTDEIELNINNNPQQKNIQRSKKILQELEITAEPASPLTSKKGRRLPDQNPDEIKSVPRRLRTKKVLAENNQTESANIIIEEKDPHQDLIENKENSAFEEPSSVPRKRRDRQTKKVKSETPTMPEMRQGRSSESEELVKQPDEAVAERTTRTTRARNRRAVEIDSKSSIFTEPEKVKQSRKKTTRKGLESKVSDEQDDSDQNEVEPPSETQKNNPLPRRAKQKKVITFALSDQHEEEEELDSHNKIKNVRPSRKRAAQNKEETKVANEQENDGEVLQTTFETENSKPSRRATAQKKMNGEDSNGEKQLDSPNETKKIRPSRKKAAQQKVKTTVSNNQESNVENGDETSEIENDKHLGTNGAEEKEQIQLISDKRSTKKNKDTDTPKTKKAKRGKGVLQVEVDLDDTHDTPKRSNRKKTVRYDEVVRFEKNEGITLVEVENVKKSNRRRIKSEVDLQNEALAAKAPKVNKSAKKVVKPIEDEPVVRKSARLRK